MGIGVEQDKDEIRELILSWLGGERIEYRRNLSNSDAWVTVLNEWQDLKPFESGGKISYRDGLQYRIKPRPTVLNIGGISVPAPETRPLEKDVWYYIPNLYDINGAWTNRWTGSEEDNFRLRSGLVHLCMDAAMMHTKAIISLSTGVVDEINT